MAQSVEFRAKIKGIKHTLREEKEEGVVVRTYVETTVTLVADEHIEDLRELQDRGEVKVAIANRQLEISFSKPKDAKQQELGSVAGVQGSAVAAPPQALQNFQDSTALR